MPFLFLFYDTSKDDYIQMSYRDKAVKEIEGFIIHIWNCIIS